MTAEPDARLDVGFPRGIAREVTPLSMWAGDTLVYRTVAALAAISIPLVAGVHWTQRGELPLPQLIYAGSMLVGALACIAIARRGAREIAAALLLGLLWLATTIYAFNTGYGMHSALVFAYLPCLLYSALFFGVVAASVNLALTTGTLFLMYVGEVNGRLAGAAGIVATGTALNYLVGIVATLVATLAGGVIYHRRIEREARRVVAEAERYRIAMEQAHATQARLESAHARLAADGAEVDRRAKTREREIHQLSRDQAMLLTALAQDLPASLGGGGARAVGVVAALAELADCGRHPIRREAVDVSALARRAAESARAIPGCARVSIRIDPGLKAHADRELLSSLFARLLDRALKACAAEPEPAVHVGAGSVEGRPVLFVRDNGPALDAAACARLLQPFGKGMREPAIEVVYARCVVERHGGELELVSHPGEGTTVYLSLPA